MPWLGARLRYLIRRGGGNDTEQWPSISTVLDWSVQSAQCFHATFVGEARYRNGPKTLLCLEIFAVALSRGDSCQQSLSRFFVGFVPIASHGHTAARTGRITRSASFAAQRLNMT